MGRFMVAGTRSTETGDRAVRAGGSAHVRLAGRRSHSEKEKRVLYATFEAVESCNYSDAEGLLFEKSRGY